MNQFSPSPVALALFAETTAQETRRTRRPRFTRNARTARKTTLRRV